jgi:acyl-coenzyme A thioesterase PaaI-like protein
MKSWGGPLLMRCLGMTKSMTVDFLKPITIDKELKAVGKVVEVKSDRECLAQAMIFNETGELYAKSIGTFALFKPDQSKKLGIKDEDEMEWFNSYMKA